MKHLKFLFLCFLLVPVLAFAHGPSRQKALVTMEVHASPTEVWAIVSDFCSITNWNSMVKTCNASQGSEKGSVRTIEYDTGEKVTEKLYKNDTENMKMLYAMEQLEKGRIMKGLPIATLSTTISITPADNGASSLVQMKGAFYRAFPGPTPPEDQTDAAALAAVTTLYQTGLEGIKAAAGGK
jgi:Polyketide cyclase / dehydrase and lipid transport